MKIMYIAGFFAPILNEIQGKAGAYLDERSLVWIQQRQDRQLDINQLKADLFDQARRGATEILICFFAFRDHERIFTTLNSIKDAATSRHPNLGVTIQRFENARDSPRILAAIQSFGPHRKIAFPESLDSLESWAQRNWSGKLLLHPRALRGAKQSAFEEVDLVYAALTLLAEEYWNLRTATPTTHNLRNEALEKKLEAHGLELAPSIASSRAGEQGDEYFIAYPGSGQPNRMLDLHLKKGSDREARNCLRIYFFWDAEERLIVIGWLTSHLGTRAT
jgi:hypothetical protein